MALTTLAGTKWTFKETLNLGSSQVVWGLNFKINNNEEFISLCLNTDGTYSYQGSMWYNNVDNEPTCNYTSGSWTTTPDQIYITGGSMATNATVIAWFQSNATQITNLTGTQWILDDELVPEVSELIFGRQIDFISNDTLYTYLYREYTNPTLGIYEDSLSYNGFEVYSFGVWNDTAYQTISITGGNDVSDAEFINWLVYSATFQGLIASKWKLSSTPTAITATWSVNFTSNQQSFTSISVTSSPLTITYANSTTSVVVYQNGAWVNEAYRRLNITSGTAMTDKSFIAWLQSCGVYLTAPTIHIKASDAWKDGEAFVKVNGTWKDATAIYIKANNTWKEI